MSLLESLLNPDRRTEAAQEQAALREKFGHRVDRHPAQIKFLHGMAREQSVMPAIEDIYSGVNGQTDILPELLARLAEGYALQARLKEAAEVAPDGEHKAEYEARARAVDNCGVRQCACPATLNRPKPGNAKGENYPSLSLIEEVCDGKRIIALTRCSLCKAISAHTAQ